MVHHGPPAGRVFRDSILPLMDNCQGVRLVAGAHNTGRHPARREREGREVVQEGRCRAARRSYHKVRYS